MDKQKGFTTFMKTECGFAPILIILLVAILGIGGYFVYTNYANNQTSIKVVPATPADSTFDEVTPNETTTPDLIGANWKTIKVQSWEFKIPLEWHYLACTNVQTVFIGVKNTDQDLSSECILDSNPGVLMIFKPNPQKDTRLPKTLEEAVPEPKEGVKTDSNGQKTTYIQPMISNKSYLSVGGEKAIAWQEEWKVGMGSPTNTYKVFILSKATTITLDDLTQRGIFEQILSTFKFTQ